MVEGAPADPLRLVCFELRRQELALPIAEVRETLTLRPITRVWLSPAWLAGIFSLRGDIVPVVDLGVLLGLPATNAGDDSRIVVVERGGKLAGMLVDRLCELRTVDAATIEAAPPGLAPEVAALLRGLVATATGTVRVLDLDALFSPERIGALAGTEERTA